jgi:hypothetical protein
MGYLSLDRMMLANRVRITRFDLSSLSHGVLSVVHYIVYISLIERQFDIETEVAHVLHVECVYACEGERIKFNTA